MFCVEQIQFFRHSLQGHAILGPTRLPQISRLEFRSMCSFLTFSSVNFMIVTSSKSVSFVILMRTTSRTREDSFVRPINRFKPFMVSQQEMNREQVPLLPFLTCSSRVILEEISFGRRPSLCGSLKRSNL